MARLCECSRHRWPRKQIGRPARKNAITACVRLLFIDLWRLFNGQLQASEIGLI